VHFFSTEAIHLFRVELQFRKEQKRKILSEEILNTNKLIQSFQCGKKRLHKKCYLN